MNLNFKARMDLIICHQFHKINKLYKKKPTLNNKIWIKFKKQMNIKFQIKY